MLPEGRRSEPGREPVPGGPGRPAPRQHAPRRGSDARRLPGRVEPNGAGRVITTSWKGPGRDVTAVSLLGSAIPTSYSTPARNCTKQVWIRVNSDPDLLCVPSIVVVVLLVAPA